VPQAGAADRLSFALANVAVGNAWNVGALECAVTGPTLEFEADALVALGGADMAATLNGERVPLFTAVPVKSGAVLKLGRARKGVRAYVALSGGLVGDAFLDSISTFAPAKLGGLGGRALRTDDVVVTAQTTGTPKDIPAAFQPVMAREWFLRAIPGPESDIFDDQTRARFFSSPFVANARANRMGLQLDGGRIAPPAAFLMNSSPVFPGTVQCPPSGAPFLLLADAQTTGGYARIAQVIDADIHLAGQISPGDRVWFIETSLEKGRATTAQKTALYSALLQGFRFG
jgi:biotin-dependent carboxylase-like uncharacterized protein